MTGPLRDQLRQTRLTWLGELEAALEQIRSKIGQPRLCSLKAVERKVNARLRESKAAGFMAVTVYTTPTGQITLHWRRNQEALAERCEGRSLLVTNDRSLSHHEMFRLYRQKDGQALRSIVPTARDTHTPPHRGGCSNDTGCPQLRSRRR